ncbi:MAG: ATP-binding cassette domain-containing protein, partial [Leptospiraceae bacterium]|nr:ATP-binding cassette domain-containing protein [Leptospiraceae bacterium]
MSLIAKQITKSFGNPPIEIIHPLNLEIKKGEFVAITGRSGSGKSTLLYLLSGLDPLTSGELFYSGIPYLKMNEEEKLKFRNLKMGFVFQFHYLLPEFTALENALLPVTDSEKSKQKEAEAVEILKMFELDNCIK